MDPAAALVSSNARTGVSRAHKRRLRLLVASQVTVAVVLLIGGGLVLRSFESPQGMQDGQAGPLALAPAVRDRVRAFDATIGTLRIDPARLLR